MQRTSLRFARSPLTPTVRQRRQGAVAPLRSRSNLRRLRVVRLLRVGPRPALFASPSGPPRHASPSSAPFPPVLHGGSAAPPASPPRGSFLIPSRHSSRLYRCLSVYRRTRLPARPPLLASPRLIKTTTSARRPCRAGILASNPIPLPNRLLTKRVGERSLHPERIARSYVRSHRQAGCP